MLVETLERSSFEIPKFDFLEKLRQLNKSYDSSVLPANGYYQNLHSDMDGNIARWLELDDAAQVGKWKTGIFDVAKQMYSGIEIDGKKTLGLDEISKWKIDPEYRQQNLKQHAGFSAEVIGTAKENLLAQKAQTGITTYRADDLPETFSKNDQYVDKVRVNAQNEIIERVQTKFVGKNGEECLSKLASKKYDKYFNDGMVDKIEIPKDFYDDIRSNNLIGKKINSLEEQLARVKAEGKTEVVQNIESKIDRYNKIDKMLERSTVSQDEAIYATKHPKSYTAKLFAQDIVSSGHETGVKSGLVAAGITLTVSTVDKVSAFVDGEISAEEMAVEIVKDTGAAGALGYGTAFVSTAVSQAMSKSSSVLIKSVGGSCLPATAVSFAVDSYDSISDFAQGKIDGAELAYDLGENAASFSGSFAGGAMVGASVGTVAGPVGTVAGSLVGGVVGCAVASEVYATAVEVGAEGAELVAEQAEKLAQDTVKLVEEHIPEKLEDVKSAFHDFINNNNLPFKL